MDMKNRDYYRVYANINLDAIHHNVENMKKLLKPGTKLMAVIKADGYGHGAVPVAEALEDVADAYGVAILEEGIELRQAGVTKPILILGYTPKPLYRPMIENDIATAVFTREMGREISDAAAGMGRTARIHMKLDTGMGRIGFRPGEESLADIKWIAGLPGIAIEGCFTHFARMDEADKTRAKEQLRSYLDFVGRIEEEGIIIPVKHVSNSAGIIDMPEAGLDMVRDGISVYGMYPSEEVQRDRVRLEPAMELKAYVSFVKTLPAGVQISYGGTYTTTRVTRVATIPVGYADGYPRALSGKGHVLIHGQSAPVLGRICMDQFMVDVTDIPNTMQGDEVTLIGRDGDCVISVEELAGMSGSFHYEFVCDVGKRVPRVYYRNGKKIGTKDFYPDF